MTTVELPESTRRRLTQLLQLLKGWKDSKITSVAISESTGWSRSLIRHDLWLIQFNKGVSNGYNVQELLSAIEKVLGCEQTTFESASLIQKNVCIAGLGRLGAALLDNNLIEGSPFQIKAGFDTNVNRVEILRSTFPLYPASEMDYVVKTEKINYAILAVADKDAQAMTNRLLRAGIIGIVNMTNIILKVPDGVKVENLSILNSLNLVI